ncbi:MAG: helix-hairpin-helix domain-containing protein [Candidatus Cloacimonadaceae bacterium]|nr:helix-hairpin-helix domain-containing protein [Candidatus Cloacimonadaceae bacterium]
MGSVDAIRDASIEQLSSIKNIGEKTAVLIYEFFHPSPPTDSTEHSPDIIS